MLKKRLIPLILVKSGRCVKGKNFSTFRDTGFPITVARIYDSQGADELIILNIDPSSKEKFLEEIQEVADQCFMPLTIGGGIQNINDVKILMKKGADKVSINTYAVKTPSLITEIAKSFGAQAVVVSIDVKKKEDGKYEVYTQNATNPTGLEVVEWAKKVEQLGAGEILLTSIDKEGLMEGYDLELLKIVSDAVTLPVIAAGGAGKMDDFVNALNVGHASAVSAGSLLNFTDQSVIKIRKFMKEAGVNIRDRT